MAKAVRGRPRKKAARKAPVPVKRKAAVAPLTSAAKLEMLIDNLTAKDLDELIKIATDRKNAEIAGARASFLDEVKSRAAKFLGSRLPTSSASEARRARRLAPDRLPNIAIPLLERPGRAVAVRQNGSPSSRLKGKSGRNSRSDFARSSSSCSTRFSGTRARPVQKLLQIGLGSAAA